MLSGRGRRWLNILDGMQMRELFTFRSASVSEFQFYGAMPRMLLTGVPKSGLGVSFLQSRVITGSALSPPCRYLQGNPCSRGHALLISSVNPNRSFCNRLDKSFINGVALESTGCKSAPSALPITMNSETIKPIITSRFSEQASFVYPPSLWPLPDLPWPPRVEHLLVMQEDGTAVDEVAQRLELPQRCAPLTS
jgi:hypothetical protein